MKIRCGLLAFLLLGSSTMAYAGNGIKRSEWSLRTELTTSNIIYGCVGMVGIAAVGSLIYDGEEFPWWFPTIQPRTADLHTPECKDKLLNFGFPDYSIGETVNYMSKEFPIGFWAKVAYERQGFETKKNNVTFSKQMIVPELGLLIRFGKYRTAENIFTLNVGASYDYAFSAKGQYNGTECINSGFSGVIGFSYGSPSQHFQMGFTATIPFYSYFNKNFSPDGGITHPYEKWDGKTFIISEYIRFGF